MKVFGLLLFGIIGHALSQAVDKASVELHVVCDDKLWLYVDGDLKISNQKLTYPDGVTSLALDAHPSTVAIKCRDTGGVGGVLASVMDQSASSVTVTDSSWKCFTGAEPTGWQYANFNDSAWAGAREIPDRYWQSHTFEGIATGAKWIWTKRWPLSKTVYCRKTWDIATDESETAEITTITIKDVETTTKSAAIASNTGYKCKDSPRKNPCKPLKEKGRYYYPHVNSNMFVQCDHWGGCYNMHCPRALVWNEAKNTCVRP